MNQCAYVRFNKLGALVAIALLSGAANAQQPGGEGSGIAAPAGGIPMGPMTAYPSVSYELQRNDNIFLQAPGSGLVQSDTIQVLKPAVRVEGKTGANAFGVGIGAESGRYSSSSADNYDNNNARAFVNLSPDARVRLGLNAEHLDVHDPRGSTNDPLTPTPNRYRQGTLGGIFGFGAQGAQGRFELELSGVDKHYYNNRATTAINDQDARNIGGTFYWRVAPRTSLLAQVKRTSIDFTDSASTLDSTEMRYLGGVTWEATAATTGIFKIGQINKDFNDSTKEDSNRVGWEAQVRWSPLTYSQWDFATSKQPRETTGAVGNFIMGSLYSARWTHAWTSQFSTALSGSYATDEYKGIDRTDNISSLGLRGTYQMRRWLSFGADYGWSKRDSNVDTADYTRNILLLFVSATL